MLGAEAEAGSSMHRQACQILPAKHDAAGVAGAQPNDHVERCCLAGAIGAQ